MFNEPMPHETLRQAEDLFYRHDWTGLEMALLSVQQAHREGVVIDTPTCTCTSGCTIVSNTSRGTND